MYHSGYLVIAFNFWTSLRFFWIWSVSYLRCQLIVYHTKSPSTLKITRITTTQGGSSTNITMKQLRGLLSSSKAPNSPHRASEEHELSCQVSQPRFKSYLTKEQFYIYHNKVSESCKTTNYTLCNHVHTKNSREKPTRNYIRLIKYCWTYKGTIFNLLMCSHSHGIRIHVH
jgi:hypothetical protein